MANRWRDREARPLPYQVDDFLMRPDGSSSQAAPVEYQQTQEEQIAAARLITEFYNAALAGGSNHGR